MVGRKILTHQGPLDSNIWGLIRMRKNLVAMFQTPLLGALHTGVCLDEHSNSDHKSDEENEYEEVNETWRVGMKLGLSTNDDDGDATQAIYEERKEWKKGNRKNVKKKEDKSRKKKARGGSRESLISKRDCSAGRWEE